MNDSLSGKVILITGAARRLGRIFALACARAEPDVVIHHGHSDEGTESVRAEIVGWGQKAWIFEADWSDPVQAGSLIPSINDSTPLFGLVNILHWRALPAHLFGLYKR